jgi:multidrug resistance protein
VLGAVLGLFIGFGIVIPLLPVYSKAYGASETTMGLLFATFSAMQFLFAPMWGRLSDKIGRRPVLVGGLFGTAASYALFALSDSLWMLFLSRALAGFLAANISTAMAYVADVTTPENRAKGMGMIGAAFGIGFTLGPLMGGELTHISPAAPGWAAAGFSLLAALYAWTQLVEPPRERRQSRVFSLEQVRGALADDRIRTPYVLSFLFIVAFASFESMFTAFGLARFPDVFGLGVPIEEASVEQILAAAPITGRYLAGIGVVSAIIQGGLIRRLVPKYGETKLAMVGPWFLAAGFLVVALAQDWTMVVIGCLLMPIGFGLNNPSVNSLISATSRAPTLACPNRWAAWRAWSGRCRRASCSQPTAPTRRSGWARRCWSSPASSRCATIGSMGRASRRRPLGTERARRLIAGVGPARDSATRCGATP